MKLLTLRGLSLLSMIIVLAGCTEGKSSSESGFTVEKKYSLEECVVRLNFIWDDDIGYADKQAILQKISEQINKAIV